MGSHKPCSFASSVVAVSLIVLVALPIACSKRTTSDPSLETAAVNDRKPETLEAAAESDDAAAPQSNQGVTSGPIEPGSEVGQLGQLKIRFQYGGNVPQPVEVAVNRDIAYCGKIPLLSERLLVSPENKGIKNVIVYLHTRGLELPELPRSKQTLTLANQNCRFEPHVLVMQAGDTLRVTNEDEVGHNTNLSFINNSPRNSTVQRGADQMFTLVESELAPIPVACNIHPWMTSYLVVLDHPFVAVSGENGELAIPGLPVGQKLVFRVWHEAGRIDEVTVDDTQTSWKRSRFEVDVQPGVNDLGTVVIPAEALNVE